MTKISPEVEDALADAVSVASENPGVSIARLARQFDVPYRVLLNRINGIGPAKGKKATHTLLSAADEDALCVYLDRFDRHNMPLTKENIVSAANSILKEKSSSRLATPPTVGIHWVDRFVKRKGYTIMRQKHLDAKRKEAESIENINRWFNLLQQTIQELGILEEDIWNVDETGFQMGMANTQQVVTKQPTLTRRKVFENRETATVVETVSANSNIGPLFVIFKGQEHLASWYNSPALERHTRIALEHFHTHTDKYRKGDIRLLLLDGFGSHHTKEFIEKCDEYNIYPFCFPSHTTHLLQPLDVGVFQPLKHAYSKHLLSTHRDGFTNKVKETFLVNVTKARKEVLRESIIASAFKKAGIVPFNPLVVLQQLPDPQQRPTTPPPSSANLLLSSPFNTPQKPRQVLKLGEEIANLMAERNVDPVIMEKFALLEKAANRQSSEIINLQRDLDRQRTTRAMRDTSRLNRNYRLRMGGSLSIEDTRFMTRNRAIDDQARIEAQYQRAIKRSARERAKENRLESNLVRWEARELEYIDEQEE